MNVPSLRIIFIDVGWGDSILLHATDALGNHEFALVDCNDSTNSPSGKNFLKRYFERLGRWPGTYPVFKYVFTTHAHDDHFSGIQGVLRAFGTESLYSSHCNPVTSLAFANLRRWAQSATSNRQPVATTVDFLWRNKTPLTLGPARIDVLWPPDCAGNAYDSGDENNNSLVLAFTFDGMHLVLTGDCEGKNFNVRPAADYVQIPKSELRMVQAPHHGARNGIFDGTGTKSSFLDQIIPKSIPKVQPPLIGISCHPRPHNHPHTDVIKELDLRGVSQPYRTDQHYHLVFIAEDGHVAVEYTH